MRCTIALAWRTPPNQGKAHLNSLLLGSSSVAYALHYSIGLAHPTKPSFKFLVSGLYNCRELSKGCLQILTHFVGDLNLFKLDLRKISWLGLLPFFI
ncbi:hypothetical protein O6P43_016989 [Quillaja saponaria]|uniref:Uncharacterized protein n=1 Tax=Quillaja saponaria TaxID=32244 RepID=A0AAD7LP67_QUISA|nr:hypothetical protein O6P43_016989 [Quillaja saponaria]